MNPSHRHGATLFHRPLLACALLACLPAQVSARPASDGAHSTPSAGTVSTSSTALGALDLAARRLEVHQNGRLIALTGNVRLDLDRLRVRAGRLSLRLAGDGTPRSLEGSGGIRLQLGQQRGSAKRLRLVLRSNSCRPTRQRLCGTLELLDGAELELGQRGLRLRGQRIWVDLATRRVTVDRARISLRARRGAPDEAQAGEQQ